MTVLIALGLHGLARSAPAQEAVIATDRPFAPGAVEKEQDLRGTAGWPTYQEGVADGLFYRFDPDGYARFIEDERQEGWEIVCMSWPRTSCTATRGEVTLTVSDNQRIDVAVAGAPAEARFFLENGEDRSGTLGSLFSNTPVADLPHAKALVPEHGGEPLPIGGLVTVARYIGWIQNGGTVPPALELPSPALPPEPESISPPAAVLAEPAAGVSQPEPDQAPPPPPPEVGPLVPPAASTAEPAADAPPLRAVQAPPPAPVESEAVVSPAAPMTEAPSPEPDQVPSEAQPLSGPPASPLASALQPEPARALPPPPVPAPRRAVPARETTAPVPAPAPLPMALSAARKTGPAKTVRLPGSKAGSLRPAAPLSCPVPPLSADKPLGDSIDSLRGLTGVSIFTDFMAEPDELKGKLRRQVRQRVEERLRTAGMRLLDKRQLEQEPGKPRLEFYLTRGDRTKDCPFRIAITLRQEVALGRDTTTQLYTGTWSETGPSRLGFTKNAEIESVAYYLESFIVDWRAANSGKPREEHRPIPRPKHEMTWGRWIDQALGVSFGVNLPLTSGDEQVSEDGPSGLGQDRQPPSTPTISTTLAFNWPTTPWFGRLTLYKYLDPSRQKPWNPDFAYAFGYDDYRPGTFSFTYGNYGGNRFDPDGNEDFTRLDQGSLRVAYKFEFEDQLVAPLFTDETRLVQCQPAITTVPRYFDQSSNSTKSFKTALSFGCRYSIWRSFFIGATAFVYPDPDQQQDWDPDYSYSFGWSNWRPGTFSIEYSNASGNRWPWREGGNGGFLEGAVSLNYRVPLEDVIDWFAEP